MASDGGGGLEAAAACATPGAWSPAATLQRVREAIAAFATERGWAKFHRPRSIMLALVGEIGELAECFQWKGDEGAEVGLPQFSDSEKVHVGEELADVLVYTIRLADLCGIDLASAVEDKLAKNRAKYPADKCYGKSDKYTAYADADKK